MRNGSYMPKTIKEIIDEIAVELMLQNRNNEEVSKTVHNYTVALYDAFDLSDLEGNAP